MNWQERAEKAEAELARMAKQEPVTYVFDPNGYAINGKHTEIADALPIGMDLYAAPVPAVAAGLPAIGPYRDFIPAPAVPAPSVPEEWREVMTELADDLAIEIDQSYPPERRAYPSEQRRYEGEMAIVNRARALLQSSQAALAVPDCRTCANRGRVNGLSQESYCDSCVYQGRDCRQNHFVDASKMVDAVKRRCEACAILPCSCK